MTATVGGTFRRDVVVAVENVTDVLVVKLADKDVPVSFNLSFCSVGFSTTFTLSTSSVDSSPRKNPNIIASFDFLSRFL